jgi:hypothetical protein
LRGKIRGVEVRLSGGIRGDGYFWRAPKLEATATSRFDLSELAALLPPKSQAAIAKYRVRGQAQSDTRINAALENLNEADFSGNVQLRSVSFDPGLDFLSGTFTGVEGKLAWNGVELKLDDFAGTLNGERLRWSGSLSREGIVLRLKSTVELRNVLRTFPRMQRWFEMSGPADCDLTFSVGGPVIEPGHPHAQRDSDLRQRRCGREYPPQCHADGAHAGWQAGPARRNPQHPRRRSRGGSHRSRGGGEPRAMRVR